ncbi:non-homologous end-joining DNA ligase [Prauserella isguenensis]|nr:non-homologous end-joining DNA ligase [Prauserella isguenensis]
MLATSGDPPAGPGWAFEWKWDGVRAIVAAEAGGVQAWSRNLRPVLETYPELRQLGELVDRPVMVDGELVTLDTEGRPDFGRLQSRMHVQRPTTELLASTPVAFYVFDLLADRDADLTGLTYLERRERLAALGLAREPWLRTPPHYTDMAGGELLAIAGEHGLEGVVAKRLQSRYLPGRRSRDWIKTPLRQAQEVVIGGWVPGQGRRSGALGSLLLGVHDAQGALRYSGHVGTGFTDTALAQLQEQLERIETAVSPFAGAVPREYTRHARWVEPVLVGEVEHRQWTADGRLRHPSWRGLRPDRNPGEVVRV